jgi:hypothetical protein
MAAITPASATKPPQHDDERGRATIDNSVKVERRIGVNSTAIPAVA